MSRTITRRARTLPFPVRWKAGVRAFAMFACFPVTHWASGVAPPGSVSWTTAGTYPWTVPAGVYSVTFTVLGGGAGGGEGDSGSGQKNGAGGGGQGGICVKTVAVTPGDTFTITVGPKGLGGGKYLGSDGQNGTGSGVVNAFGFAISATGGVRGPAGDNGSGVSGGAGGTATGGDTNTPGASGSPNNNTNNAGGAGGGGGLGGASGVDGQDSPTPGGGGGGGGKQGKGGNGADGSVSITW